MRSRSAVGSCVDAEVSIAAVASAVGLAAVMAMLCTGSWTAASHDNMSLRAAMVSAKSGCSISVGIGVGCGCSVIAIEDVITVGAGAGWRVEGTVCLDVLELPMCALTV